LQEVANQAERVALLEWDDVTAEKLAALTPSESLRAVLPAATLQATLAEEAGPPASKRVRIEIHWTNSAGIAVEPVGLTIWKHETEDNP
jgi:hypothetical protein